MDYLVSKWKLWFHSLDVNHDGKISFEDVEESRNKFTDLHKLIGEKATGVKVDMEAWWNKYIFKEAEGAELSEDMFIEQNMNSYKKDSAAFTKEITECFNMIFDVIDTNKDRTIELNEFIYAFKAFGHENEGLVKKAYELMKPTKEGIPLCDIVQAWVNFVTNPDSSKPDVIKQAFDAGV